MLKSW